MHGRSTQIQGSKGCHDFVYQDSESLGVQILDKPTFLYKWSMSFAVHSFMNLSVSFACTENFQGSIQVFFGRQINSFLFTYNRRAFQNDQNCPYLNLSVCFLNSFLNQDN